MVRIPVSAFTFALILGNCSGTAICHRIMITSDEDALHPMRKTSSILLLFPHRAVVVSCLRSVVVSCLAALAMFARVVYAETPRPPIVLITVDTLRADHLSCYGYERQTSPAIDALARDGVLYSDAHVTTTRTSPSLISILTGLYPRSHRATELRIKADARLKFIAQVMKESGYKTAGICGQYNCHRSIGFARGFDLYDDHFELLPGEKNDFNFAHDGEFHPEAERRASELVDRAVEWLKGQGGTTPPFLWIHFMDPHLSYSPPAPFDVTYTDTPPRWINGPREIPLERINPHAAATAHTDIAFYVNRYDGEIKYLDTELSRLFSYMKTSKLYNDALIVFSSDHGEYMGEYPSDIPAFTHGKTLFETETRAPLIVKYPNQKSAGTISSDTVSSVDIAPFLSAFVGRPLQVADGIDLRSVSPETLRTIFVQRPQSTGVGFAAYSRGVKLVLDTGVSQSENEVLVSHGVLRSESKQLFSVKGGAPETRADLVFDPVKSQELERAMLEWLSAAPHAALADIKSEQDNSKESIKRLKTLGYLQ